MSIPESKKCTNCKETLSKEFFYESLKDGRRYLASRCIECSKIYGKKYRIDNNPRLNLGIKITTMRIKTVFRKKLENIALKIERRFAQERGRIIELKWNRGRLRALTRHE
jgi:hypothetical protein